MKNNYWVFKIVVSIFLINSLLPVKAQSEEVPFNHLSRVALSNGATWQWQVTNVEGLQFIEVINTSADTKSTEPILKADISRCSFCSGEEDNCSEDGIKILETASHPNAFIRVICHVGAHSQQLMIFDPQQDSVNPVLQRIGVYWVSSILGKKNLLLSYDKSGFGKTCPNTQPSARGICAVHEVWPK